MMNNTVLNGSILNNSTSFINESLFRVSNVTYMDITDIHNIDSAIKFYSACFLVYPHIFIPIVLVGLIIGIKVVKNYERNKN